MLGFLKRIFGGASSSREPSFEYITTKYSAQLLRSIIVEEEELQLDVVDAEPRRVSRTEISSVLIVTTDHGPFDDDVFWVFSDDEGNYALAQSRSGFEELISYFMGLPGADKNRVIEAMGSTANREFAIWSKSD